MQGLGQSAESMPSRRYPPPPSPERRKKEEEKEDWLLREVLGTDQEEQVLHGLQQNAAKLRRDGIYTDEKTGRNIIKRNTSFTPEAIQRMEELVIHRELGFAQKNALLKEKEQKKDAEVNARASALEKIIALQFAKCLPEEYSVYLSSRFGDVSGYDIVFVNRKTGKTEFVADVTLGKNDPGQPVSREKIKEVRQKIIDGTIVYDGHEYNGKTYVPAASVMTPLLLVSLPDRTLDGEDNLERMLNRMSWSMENPSKKDFTNATYLTRQLLKSMDENNLNFEHIHNSNLFDTEKIQKRTERLRRMLTPAERAKRLSAKDEVRIAIEQWPKNIKDLKRQLQAIKEKLTEKSDCDPDELQDTDFWNEGY